MAPVIALLVGLAVYLVLPASTTPRLHGVTGRGVATGRSPLGELRRRGRASRLRRQRSEEALAALVALASELRAGLPPELALVNASTTVWPTALAAIRLDGDVPDALRADAATTPVLRSLAACWQVGASSGSGLANAVDRLAQSHREADDVRGQLEVQLAGPRATARMLALLPLIGIAMGAMLGADPLGFLLGSPVGIACLAAGVGLTAVGMWWTNRIAARVEARL